MKRRDFRPKRGKLKAVEQELHEMNQSIQGQAMKGTKGKKGKGKKPY